jgi:cysteine desulfurase
VAFLARIYFDNAATTAVSAEVLQEMLPWFSEKFGNPSSIHSYGRESRMAIEKSRKIVASHMGCKPGRKKIS